MRDPSRNRKFLSGQWILALTLSGALLPSAAQAAPPGAKERSGGVAAPTRKALGMDGWKDAARAPLKRGEIDELLQRELQAEDVKTARRTTDEQFLRRVWLDLTGELPAPADVQEFLADTSPDKRARMIDRLLDTEEYARHWARYWSDVFLVRITDPRARAFAPAFEDWLSTRIHENRSWGAIAREIITANGEMRYATPAGGESADSASTGASFFLVSYRGAEAANERAAETSRVFMGIQIQCAQCHDHPFDKWKQEQFHQLASYFARVRERPVRDGQRVVGFELVSLPGGEHQMPDKNDPRRGKVTHPRFLDGRTPGQGLPDQQRRDSLAASIISRDNPWFAAAYVNRMWGELMGQAFYQPVDDMGPEKEAVFPSVLTRLTAAFQTTNYDMKLLFREILNSEAYQRQIRPGESADSHLLFAAVYPSRLRADALYQSLVEVLGSLSGPPRGPRGNGGPFARLAGFEGQFKEEFRFDPSTKPDEVEGTIPQALLLMNNPVLNQRIQARGSNVLSRILSSYPGNDEALRMVYLKVLARKPTDREKQRCLDFIRDTGSRAEAFEDILWALLNSTEFQTRR